MITWYQNAKWIESRFICDNLLLQDMSNRNVKKGGKRDAPRFDEVMESKSIKTSKPVSLPKESGSSSFLNRFSKSNNTPNPDSSYLITSVDRKSFLSRGNTILFIAILLSIFAFTYMFLLSDLSVIPVSEPDKSPDLLTDDEPVLEVVSPDGERAVEGIIYLSGRASASLESLLITLYDSERNILGESRINFYPTPDSEEILNWDGIIEVSKSPTTSDGMIIITSDRENSENEISINHPIRFEVQNGDKTSMISPLRFQVSNNTTVDFYGMSESTESVLNLILESKSGEIISFGSLKVSSDRSISGAITVPEIPEDEMNDSGKWIITDSDGRVLLEIPVAFISTRDFESE